MKRGGHMARETVGIVIERLLTDEELRGRFVVDRVETLGELHGLGLQLTASELDLFIESDVETWSWIGRRVVVRMH